MARILVLMLLFCQLPYPALAGAWPREKGGYFVASDLRLSWPQDLSSRNPTGQYYTTYLEYGLTRTVTLGLDLGRSVSGDGKAVGFLRLPLVRADNRLKIAAELGLGRIEGFSVVRPGLSVGRSFDWKDAHGWMALDSVAEIKADSGDTDLKLDLTFGLTARNGRKYIVQLQSGAPARRDPFLRLAPSLVIPWGSSRLVEVGATYGLTGDDSFGVKLGLWQNF